ncbi:MAG: hypothetical protein NVS4B8_09340 [Herpetosiphon sp.]
MAAQVVQQPGVGLGEQGDIKNAGAGGNVVKGHLVRKGRFAGARVAKDEIDATFKQATV